MTDRAKELAAALRCTSTAGEGQGCTRCSFWRVEQVPEELRQGIGTAEWGICDVDRIGWRRRMSWSGWRRLSRTQRRCWGGATCWAVA